MLFKICVVCGNKFFKRKYDSKSYWLVKKCCSKECGLKISGFKKGQTSWNKGLIGVMPKPWNKGLKVRLSPNSEFKKGDNTGENHRLWKGESANKKSKHSWVKRHKGKSKQCSFCGKLSQEYTIDWANTDHQYKRNLDDYIELCRSCHRLYDIKNNHYKL